MAPRRQADILVVGGINTDFLVQGPRLPRAGEHVEGHLFLESLGGKGANAAVAASRLGARSTLLGRVGMDARGLALLEQLEGEGVETRAVSRDPGFSTGVVLEMVDESGRRQSLSAEGANRRLSVADVIAAEDRISGADVLLAQLAAVIAAVHIARAAGTHVVLDPAPPSTLPEELLEAVHVIRLNDAEAEVLTGLEVVDRDSARRAAENLLRRGVGTAVVAAPQGTLLLGTESELWLPNLPVDWVDTTGAGDAFSAALCVALGERRSLTDAARFAHATAALATMRLGALSGLPNRDQVVSFMARIDSLALSPEPVSW
ncbi:ribokinase [Myxococcus qinghaiensis]|uniref:ribokinase n=1 Tax=Myxococcus qinghaiensis TaxID=2906758 RepID=UPI0020A80C0C|nr:ribokinase [Myxococcus qinghaiensis]MCP3164272.1 ribokinase [Myxococcus qinghaiensis]